jgi:hypothetical protein
VVNKRGCSCGTFSLMGMSKITNQTMINIIKEIRGQYKSFEATLD